MSDRSIDELGPVDFLIVEFPPGQQHFTGEGAAELLRLHDAASSASWTSSSCQGRRMARSMAQELSDLAELGEFERIEAELVQTLAEEDVEHLAAAMDTGSVAGVLVYENLWAAPFGCGHAARGRPAHRQRPHPHPGHHRRRRGRRGPRSEGA